MEDLGWFCARGARHGLPDREAGGIGSREALYDGYRDVAGRRRSTIAGCASGRSPRRPARRSRRCSARRGPAGDVEQGLAARLDRPAVARGRIRSAARDRAIQRGGGVMARPPLLPTSPEELLQRAIETLRARLLPHTAEHAGSRAALVALRALAIAQAELASDPAIAGARAGGDRRAAGPRVRRRCHRPRAARSPPRSARAACRTMARREVRLRDHLLKATANRLRLTNPKYMTRRKRRAESSYDPSVRGILLKGEGWGGEAAFRCNDLSLASPPRPCNWGGIDEVVSVSPPTSPPTGRSLRLAPLSMPLLSTLSRVSRES